MFLFRSTRERVGTDAVASSEVVEASLRKKSDGLSFAYSVTLCANNDAKKANSA